MTTAADRLTSSARRHEVVVDGSAGHPSRTPRDPAIELAAIRFNVGDLGEGSIVERGSMPSGSAQVLQRGDPCPGDFDDSGDYTVNDILFAVVHGARLGDVDGDV